MSNQPSNTNSNSAVPNQLKTSIRNGHLSPKVSRSIKRHSDNFKAITTKKKHKSVEKNEKNYFEEERYNSNGNPDATTTKVAKWRMKERMKTVNVALVLALNIGVDPPDIIKPNPCARMECWIDTHQQGNASGKCLEQIGKKLQSQYERWQSRVRYKQCLDPTVDDVKKLCLSLRRNAKDERILFHYNGHGVPKPTNNGEIWVFNKNFTQYIPLSIYDLQSWIGSPTIFVFDCSAAGLVVDWFKKFTKQRESEHERILNANAGSRTSHPAPALIKDCILLAACKSDELLPMNPELPADVFTACLTTPIKMALRWFCTHSILKDVHPDMIDKIPGKITDRRTPLGELNWIFTAITDTIAWNTLPPDLFQKLFRQDLLVASLFRNFLLAERILRSCNCTPVTHPTLPPTYQHPMWGAWDLAADIYLSQLPAVLKDPTKEFQHNPFFSEQLSAFEVWLEFGAETKQQPEQLPIVLQVLLSQAHRIRALELLAKFLDLGPWAGNLALSVGIFPYVLKLLQSPASELRPILVFIWAKILALDKSCQMDLVKDNGQIYFLKILASPKLPAMQRAMAAFILTVIMNNYFFPGQSACLSGKLINIALLQLTDTDSLVRTWCLFCLAKVWEGYEEAKRVGLHADAHVAICTLLEDPVVEVRAAAVYSLGTFIGGGQGNEERTNVDFSIGLTLIVCAKDASPLVRKELVFALCNLVREYEDGFVKVATEMLKEDIKVANERSSFSSADNNTAGTDNSPRKSKTVLGMQRLTPHISYGKLWDLCRLLCSDPCTDVSKNARILVNSINAKMHLQNTGLAKQLKANPRLVALSPTRNTNRSKRTSIMKSLLSSSGSGIPTSAAPAPPTNSEQQNPTTDPESQLGSLQSSLYQWACQFFSKPIKRNQEDKTSPVVMEKVWKSKRKERQLAEIMAVKEKAKTCKFDTQIAILDNEGALASRLLLHPFENVLVVSDSHNFTIWNWEEGVKIHAFSNSDTSPKRITSLALANEHHNILLLSGTENGVVRVWSNYTQKEKLLSSWQAIPELSLATARAGLVFDWNQATGHLATSGNVQFIRIWDLETSLRVQAINTNANTGVTCLTHDSLGSNTIIAGCNDGSLRSFDTRGPKKYGCGLTYNAHSRWVVNVALPPSGNKIVSGSIDGIIKIFDLRMNKKPIASFTNNSTSEMTSMAVHRYAPLIATGVQNQKIRVMNFDGKELSMIRYHEGFFGQRIGPISCLAFHPYKLRLAAGATDSIISMYKSSI